MPQSLNQKTVNTFVKGLITEAGELTFPPDASVDESNCLLRRDGSRRRREAIEFEQDYELSSFTVADTELVSTGSWVNVGGNANKEYLVIQYGPRLRFYLKGSAPFSGASNVVSGSVDLSTHEYAGSSGAGNFKCNFSSINGKLVVANPAINTIYISEDSGGTISSTEISFRVRDFAFLSDRDVLSDETATSTPSDERKYDTYNSGWFDDPSSTTDGYAALTSYQSSNSSKWPPLNLPWFAAKNSSGNFSVTEFDKIQAGSTLITNGHYILDFFEKNRNTASGLTGLPTTSETTRFSCVAAFQNRMFYSGLNSEENSNVILFSKSLEPLVTGIASDTSSLGICHQVNDPTSENFYDLLETDGGEIRIPEAYGIKVLHPFNNSLYVFAENGVWLIKGIDDVFTATGYAVIKLTSVGIVNASSFISADGVPFWWSQFGIHTLSFDSQTFQSSEQNISIGTIQTLFDNISNTAKNKVSAIFDRTNKRIFWAYPNNSETVFAKVNNLLILDTELQAFYTWSISDAAANTPQVLALSYYSGFSAEDVDFGVIDSSDNTVVDSSSNAVVVMRSSETDTGDPYIVALVKDPVTNKLTMATFTGTSFLDWGSANYVSFAETGYDFMGDVMFDKNAPYLQVLLKQTETGWTGDEATGYDPIRPSSILVSSYWDFKRTNTATQQGYRLKYFPVVNPGDLSSFNYPKSVVQTRLKIRGKGKSMRFRFESEEGKDFHLLGFSVIHARNNRY